MYIRICVYVCVEGGGRGVCVTLGGGSRSVVVGGGGGAREVLTGSVWLAEGSASGGAVQVGGRVVCLWW